MRNKTFGLPSSPVPDYFEWDWMPLKKPSVFSFLMSRITFLHSFAAFKRFKREECSMCNEPAVQLIALEYSWGWGKYKPYCEFHKEKIIEEGEEIEEE